MSSQSSFMNTEDHNTHHQEQYEQPISVAHHAHIVSNTLHATQPPVTSLEDQLVQPPVAQEDCIRAGRFLRIVRHWKALTAKSRSHPPSPGKTLSSSCSRLRLILPLICIGSSSPLSSSDYKADKDVYANRESDSDTPPDSDLQSAIFPASSPPLQHPSSPSPQPLPPDLQWSGGWQAPIMKINTKDQSDRGKEKEINSHERKMQPVAGCVPSRPKLRSSLSLPVLGKYMQEANEELENLQPSTAEVAGSNENGNNTKLRRSTSSPLRQPKHVTSKLPSTPKGYLALYVGEERKKFVVKASVLNHPMFSVLLEKAEEEFGFEQKGGLKIPCDIAFFQHIMLLVESNQKVI